MIIRRHPRQLYSRQHWVNRKRFRTAEFIVARVRMPQTNRVRLRMIFIAHTAKRRRAKHLAMLRCLHIFKAIQALLKTIAFAIQQLCSRLAAQSKPQRRVHIEFAQSAIRRHHNPIAVARVIRHRRGQIAIILKHFHRRVPTASIIVADTHFIRRHFRLRRIRSIPRLRCVLLLFSLLAFLDRTMLFSEQSQSPTHKLHHAIHLQSFIQHHRLLVHRVRILFRQHRRDMRQILKLIFARVDHRHLMRMLHIAAELQQPRTELRIQRTEVDEMRRVQPNLLQQFTPQEQESFENAEPECFDRQQLHWAMTERFIVP
mmetsp:Transcript_37708/g.61988  ORF Transcript_37708/g.61988 Transcript_37708/m.61988 type:complete len:315 (-) Transcript_37708:300-1244(-)